MTDTGIGALFLDQDYIEMVMSLSVVRLAVMGVDPYPTRPTGIAFCRQTWGEMLSRGSAGLFVLESLGADVYELSDEQSLYPTPRHYFFYLAEQHWIVFINASNHFVNARFNEDTEKYFDEAGLSNLLIIENAQVTLLCGDVPQMLYGTDCNRTVACLHPSQNRPSFRRRWLNTWAPNRLKKKFCLSLDCPTSNKKVTSQAVHEPVL